MARELLRLLREKYNSAPRNLAIYPSEDMMIERISLNLTSKDPFENIGLNVTLISPEDIENIAKKIFDDRKYDFFEDTDDGISIRFPADTWNEYIQSYSYHVLSVTSRSRPKILISVGDGATELNSRQREKYLEFAGCVYDIFLKSAKEAASSVIP